MKIQCDVCQKEEASVFCSADEAALCNGCDHRIHRANKLASKHSRYSLLQPTTFKESPLCDICQERKALLFCQEDRAILCRECDLPIHRANEHTKKHNRFLLTGVKLSSAASASLNTNSSTVRKRFTSSNSNSNNMDAFLHPTFEIRSYGSGVDDDENNNQVGSTSSISEYLMETLPGWRVDDFLVEPPPPNNNYHHHLSSSTSTASNNGYCKITNEATVKMEYDLGSNNTRSQW